MTLFKYSKDRGYFGAKNFQSVLNVGFVLAFHSLRLKIVSFLTQLHKTMKTTFKNVTEFGFLLLKSRSIGVSNPPHLLLP